MFVLKPVLRIVYWGPVVVSPALYSPEVVRRYPQRGPDAVSRTVHDKQYIIQTACVNSPAKQPNTVYMPVSAL